MLGPGSSDSHLAISSEIEEVRGRLVSLGIQFGLMHPEVQQCSQQLDELLLRFYQTKQGGAAKASSL